MSESLWILAGLTITEIGALYCLKKYNIEKQIHYFIIGALAYVFIAYLLSCLFTYENIGIANFSWNILTTIAGFLIGYYLFSEAITLTQIIGASLSIVGLFIMHFHQ